MANKSLENTLAPDPTGNSVRGLMVACLILSSSYYLHQLLKILVLLGCVFLSIGPTAALLIRISHELAKILFWDSF